MTARRDSKRAPDDPAADRRMVLWMGALFLAVAVIGLALVPGLTVVWLFFLVFGILAVPQAFLRRD